MSIFKVIRQNVIAYSVNCSLFKRNHGYKF